MRIEIFGKSNCPYCTKAVKLLEKNQINYEYTDFFSLSLDEQEDVMSKATGARSYPIILIDDIYVGGFDNINAAL